MKARRRALAADEKAAADAVVCERLRTRRDIVEMIDTVLKSASNCADALSLKKGEAPTPEQQSRLDAHAQVLKEVQRKVHQMTAGYPLNKY